MAYYLSPKPSAGLLTTGLALLTAGVAFWVGAQSPALDRASAEIAMVFGWFMALPGLVLALVGLFRLARNVDLAAGVWQRPARVEAPPAAARLTAPE